LEKTMITLRPGTLLSTAREALDMYTKKHILV